MRSYLLVCFLALAISATEGFRSLQLEDPTDALPSGPTDAPTDELPTDVTPSNPKLPRCQCDKECKTLNEKRLPSFLQDETRYLSYENFPVLCRDASAILLPPGEGEQKKYVCRQTFDCCRDCNNQFYKCLSKGTVYGNCMRGAYKCMCECIDKRSFLELPYQKPAALPAGAGTESPPEQPSVPGETK